MKATTIKLGGKLLNDLEALKPDDVSLTAYVRGVLEEDVRAHCLAESAEQYKSFLKTRKDEAGWLAEWDKADLANAPRRKRP